ncbi:MAG: lipoprotein insertase outer membrane protein LolB [Chromatiales bacterium]|nr:lipoprotein insertase outer membrane protein LolB [Chromatiales bacterium]MDH4029366.1 lipoprotein insertase outer membrane protein LolB [Chromatiales bacterium]
MKGLIIGLAVVIIIGGCVSPRDRIGEALEVEWLERRDLLRQLDDWRMEGRIALRTGSDGYNGTLSWEQMDDLLDFRFRGPFGFGGFRIHGDLDRLRIKTTSGEELLMTDPEAEMRDRFGWSLPVYSMRFWIVGVSDPGMTADETVDDDGMLLELSQNGWDVSFDGYRVEDGLLLPKKIVMESGDVRIRVVADRWQIALPDPDLT